MAEHFLDTETRHEIPTTALACVEAEIGLDEAKRIWQDEVAPVVAFNLFDVAGQWAGWDEQWLVESIERQRARRSSRSWRWLRYWSSGGLNHGVWVAIARCMERLLAEGDVGERRRLALDLKILARHYFDFCGRPLAELEPAQRARLAELYAGPLLELLGPALVSGEAAEAEQRVREALGWGEVPSGLNLKALRRRFARALRALGASQRADPAFDELVRRYTRGTRHYHTLEHVAACLSWLDRFRAIADCPAEVELALWFHDSVYEPHDHDNERRSADLAEATLNAAGVPGEACRRVAEYIAATERHVGTGDGAVVVDIDLAILGASEAEFSRFESQIRREYAEIPDTEFGRARRAILRNFLARPQIYRAPALRDALELDARRNLERRIRELGG
jgi:predicted metal-dependent HD superfamily phosphohydrolase